MKKYVKYLQYLYLAATALLLACAIGVLVKNAEVTSGVPVWIGLLLVLTGLCEGMASLAWRRKDGAESEFTSRAGLKLVIGAMVLFQGVFTGSVMWVLISSMLILCGFSMYMFGRKVRKNGMRNWLWIGPVSALEMLLGVLCFLDPALLGFSTGVMVGIALLSAAAADSCVWYLGRLMKVYE